MSIFAQSLGLVAEGDVASLSSDAVVRDDVLVDKPIGAQHHINAKGRALLLWLAEPRYIGTRDVNLPAGATELDLVQVLVFANSIGALTLRRHHRSAIAHAFRRIGFALKGVKTRTIARRFRATPKGLAGAIGHALSTILIMLSVLSLVGLAANFPTSFVVANCLFFVMLAVSTYAHEYAHLQILGPKVIIVQRGLHVGVAHGHSALRNRLLSAVAGPLAGVAVCSLGVAAGRWGRWPIMVAMSAVTAALHLASWLPGYGDGKALLAQVKGAAHA